MFTTAFEMKDLENRGYFFELLIKSIQTDELNQDHLRAAVSDDMHKTVNSMSLALQPLHKI